VTGSPNSPRSFRVVVDNMLQGLGRYLRCCGVDVVMLANEDDHDRAAKVVDGYVMFYPYLSYNIHHSV
jgi:uncharacterized protein with PIN domain